MHRRSFLKSGSLLPAAFVPALLIPRQAAAKVRSPAIPKFVTPLRRAGVDIPVAVPDGTGLGGAVHYTIDMRQFSDQLLPSGFGPTTLWGYSQVGQPQRHLGAILVANRGTPVQLKFRNQLPTTHFLPVDRTVDGAQSPPDNRASVHLHGGKVPWISDGGPLAWFSSTGAGGPTFPQQQQALPTESGSAEYYYPNDQAARFMWIHDHAQGITRLNAYAGLASAYLLTDGGEQALQASAGLPGPLHERTHHLVFQDKVFRASGELWYPSVYDEEMFELGPPTVTPLPTPSAVPEFFGDTMLVNGTTYPALTLPQGVHRLRMLNACNGRFLTPRLYYASTAAPTEPNLQAPGPGFLQIGTEGGFLPAPVPVNAPSRLQLILAPAERADVLVDLRGVPAGSKLILYNDAPAPFPNGSEMTDFFAGSANSHGSHIGYGPDTRTLLQITVAAQANPAPFPTLPPDLRPYNEPLLVNHTPGVGAPIPDAVRVRQLTLNEGFDEYGRLLPLLGAATPTANGFGLHFNEPATEVVQQGSIEVWEIFNLSADTHPIHFHLVNVQILNRQRLPMSPPRRGRTLPFHPRSVNFAARPVGVDANELGWKETVRMNAGEVTRVIMRFDAPATLPFALPTLSGTDASGTPYRGYGFVWHCHMLEHEDRDMMRPLIVKVA